MHLFLNRKVWYLLIIVLHLVTISFIPLVSNASNLLFAKSQDGLQEEGEEQLKQAVHLISIGAYKDAESILLKLKDDDVYQEKAYFLLGRLYKQEGAFDKAEQYFLKVANSYRLLRDYALRSLINVYIATEKFNSAVETTKLIKSNILLQEAKRSEIMALLAQKKKDLAIDMLFQYIKDYPSDWDSKLTLAILLKNRGETDKAISLFKNIYINAVPISEDALSELKDLKADVFSKRELLKRADRLFNNYSFQEAEATYRKVVKFVDGSLKEKVRFKIGECQFRLKEYTDAASSFALIKGPKSLYWQARSLYRAGNIDAFKKVIKRFERNYPDNEHLADLLFVMADDFRRSGNLWEANEILQRIINNFPERKEEVLWRLGWMNFTSGNYSRALRYFSRLSDFKSSRDYYKYIYWKGRTLEKLANELMEFEPVLENYIYNINFFDNLPADDSYYGYLIRLRSSSYLLPNEPVKLSKPPRPEGLVYERIEALGLLGMRDEAVNEIVEALKSIRSSNEFFYLGYVAATLQEYKSIVAIAEGADDKGFLPFSYPLAFWNKVKEVADAKGLDPYLLVALMREESRFDPIAVSWAGAIGLMQLMPSTAYRLKGEVGLDLINDSELQDVGINILLGTHYLSMLIKEFKKVPFALAAYNAGKKALKNWLYSYNNRDIDEFIEDIPYKETRRYVKKVLKSYWRYRTIYGLPIEAS